MIYEKSKSGIKKIKEYLDFGYKINSLAKDSNNKIIYIIKTILLNIYMNNHEVSKKEMTQSEINAETGFIEKRLHEYFEIIDGLSNEYINRSISLEINFIMESYEKIQKNIKGSEKIYKVVLRLINAYMRTNFDVYYCSNYENENKLKNIVNLEFFKIENNINLNQNESFVIYFENFMKFNFFNNLVNNLLFFFSKIDGTFLIKKRKRKRRRRIQKKEKSLSNKSRK
jgi:hypothetical protein